MINHKSRCNGIRLDAPPFSPYAYALFLQIIQSERLRFLMDSKDPKNFEGEVAIGRNFTDTEKVWATLRSATTETCFLLEPYTWTYDALQDCAEKDAWYLNEKKF